MINLLSRIFIKNRNAYSDAKVRIMYGTLCSIVGILLNVLLFAFKFFAGIISGSVAVTADAFNNLSDAGSSIITLLGFKISAKKPDSSHPFGHGRSEYIAGLIVSFLIILMGFELGKGSVEKIISPENVVFSPLVITILAVSVAVKFYMAFYNRLKKKKIDSSAMHAASIDSISDAVATAFVLFSMFFYKYTNINIDPYCGLLVSLFILTAGIRAANETISPLLGKSADPDMVKKIEEIVKSLPEVIGMHDLIAHDYGNGRQIISLHVEVDADGDFIGLHDVIDNIERRLSDELSCIATIHMDPIVRSDTELSDVKNMICDYLATTYPNVTTHDFRMVRGNTHTNVIFDAVIPFDEKDPGKIIEDLKRRINEYNSKYFAVINADRKYS